MIGEIKNGKFVPEGEERRLHYGKNSYAAQTFSGLQGKDGVGRRVRIAWNTTHAPFEPFNCSMCIPTQMTLKTVDGSLRLCSDPIEEVQTLWAETKTYADAEALELPLACRAVENQISMEDAAMPVFYTETNTGTDTEAGARNILKLRLLVDKLGVELYQDMGQAFMCNGFLCDYTLN